MKISVLFFAQLRELAGIRQTEVTLAEGSRLVDLIQQLSRQYGSAFKREMANIAGLRILVNGQENEVLEGPETQLKEGDNIVLLPPVAGG
ncbi:MAG: MoaD/ThiS family protein [Chloroflexota bacterium]